MNDNEDNLQLTYVSDVTQEILVQRHAPRSALVLSSSRYWDRADFLNSSFFLGAVLQYRQCRAVLGA